MLCLLILRKNRITCLFDLIPGSLKIVYIDAGVERCKGFFGGPGILLPLEDKVALIFPLPHQYGAEPELVKY